MQRHTLDVVCVLGLPSVSLLSDNVFIIYVHTAVIHQTHRFSMLLEPFFILNTNVHVSIPSIT